MKQNAEQVDLDQAESKRLNDLFPINYFHREKIKKVKPLCFEHIYNKDDVFQVIETGGIFQIDSLHHQHNEYQYHWVSGSKELKTGYTTFFVRIVGGNLLSETPFLALRYLLGARDYYHVADILYDLSNEVKEIPDRLFNFIIETCDEANFVKS